MIVLTGYHGTRKEVRSLILRKNFIPSRGKEHWLGNGAYFFEEGISSAEGDAEKWAVLSAWNKQERRENYERFVVLRALIRVAEEEFLDLLTSEGLTVFNYGRQMIYDKVGMEAFQRQSADSAIIDFLAENLGFKVIRARFFIKLTKEERLMKIFSGVPNTTVLCVVDPLASISLDDVATVSEGSVAR